LFGLIAAESQVIRGEWADAITQRIRGAEVQLRAELPTMKLTVQQLLDLVPGDVVPIKSPDDVVVKVGHVEVFEGKFGTAEGQNAVKITRSALTD
ncbi:MAG: FliM/FliN family flagellar motor switch protein, partial [Pseudomonadales bacterium]